jgi:adenylyltransferase/sulfurtransferase
MPIISIVAAVQVTETLKLLTGHTETLHQSLMRFDVWDNEWRRIALGSPGADCQTCGAGRYEWLEAEAGDYAAVLCGRDAVQISPGRRTKIDLKALAERLRAAGNVLVNPYLVRLQAGDYELTVFEDARSIIRGTDDVPTARSLYAKYVGT